MSPEKDQLRHELFTISESLTAEQLHKVIELALSFTNQIGEEDLATSFIEFESVPSEEELTIAKAEQTARIYSLDKGVKGKNTKLTQKNQGKLSNVEIRRHYKFKVLEPGQLQKLFKQFVHFYGGNLLYQGPFSPRFKIDLEENGIKFTKQLAFEDISSVCDIGTSDLFTMSFDFNFLFISKDKEFFSIRWDVHANDIEEVNRLTELVETILELEQVPENEVYFTRQL